MLRVRSQDQPDVQLGNDPDCLAIDRSVHKENPRTAATRSASASAFKARLIQRLIDTLVGVLLRAKRSYSNLYPVR